MLAPFHENAGSKLGMASAKQPILRGHTDRLAGVAQAALAPVIAETMSVGNISTAINRAVVVRY